MMTKDQKLWKLFHELWGKAHDGVYDKPLWAELQRHLETYPNKVDLLKVCATVLQPTNKNLTDGNVEACLRDMATEIMFLRVDRITDPEAKI